MRLFYGAAPGQAGGAPPPNQPGEVELQILKTVTLSRQPIFDGPTLTVQQWDVEVIGRVNPFATSYTLGGVGADPVAALGAHPATTDAAIRDRLLTARRQLHLYIGNTLLVSSPSPGFACDPKLGPFPYRADILQITGDKDLVLRFGVRFYVNPCTSVVNPTATIISHRWGQERTVDQDGFCTLTTNGHAVFDAAKLQLFKTVPDDFVDGMVRPLELGFRRDSVQVVAHEDGSEIQYCLIDRETPMSIARAAGLQCSRIEAYFTSSIGRIGTTEGMEQGFETGARVGRNLLGSGGDALGIETLGQAAGVAGFAAIGAFLGGIKGTIPQQTYSSFVRVWGHPNSPKKNLELIARKIIDTLLVNSKFENGYRKVAGFDISLQWDANGRWVQASAVWKSPPVRNLAEAFKAGGVLGGGALGGGRGPGGGAPFNPGLDFLREANKMLRRSKNGGVKGGGMGADGELPADYEFAWPITPDADDVIAGDEELLLARKIPHPGIPGHVEGSEQSRGNWIGRVVAQILTITCQNQPRPPANAATVKTAIDTGGIPLA